MGLDMYLIAEKKYPSSGPVSDQILAAAGTTLPALFSLSRANPRETETEFYVGGWDFRPDEQKRYNEILDIMGAKNLATKDSPSMYITVRDGCLIVRVYCGYWRKVNAVHAWFVTNVQDGVDECQTSPVHVEQLALLRSSCLDALQAYAADDMVGAKRAMPPQEGFFFGPAALDEWWVEGMQDTVAQIDRVIAEGIALRGVDFIYQASW